MDFQINWQQKTQSFGLGLFNKQKNYGLTLLEGSTKVLFYFNCQIYYSISLSLWTSSESS
jgi:hypothetical protein